MSALDLEPASIRHAFEIRLRDSEPTEPGKNPYPTAPTPCADLLHLDDTIWSTDAVWIAGLVIGVHRHYHASVEELEQRFESYLPADGWCENFRAVHKHLKLILENWGDDWWSRLEESNIIIQQVPSFHLAFYIRKLSEADAPLDTIIADIRDFKARPKDPINTLRKHDARNSGQFGKQQQREHYLSWRFFSVYLGFRENRARILAQESAAHVTDRSRRRERRRVQEDASPMRKSTRKRKVPGTPPSRAPVSESHRQRRHSSSVERPRRASIDKLSAQEADILANTDFGDDSFAQSAFESPVVRTDKRPLPNLPHVDSSAFRADEGIDRNSSAVPPSDTMTASLEAFVADPVYRGMVRALLAKKKLCRDLKGKADAAQKRHYTAKAAFHAIETAIKTDLKLNAVPTEESLSTDEAALSGKLAVEKEYEEFLSRGLEKFKKFADRGATSAVDDIETLNTSKCALEAEIERLEAAVEQYSAALEKLRDAREDMELEAEQWQEAKQECATQENLMKTCEKMFGKVNGLLIETLEDALKKYED